MFSLILVLLFINLAIFINFKKQVTKRRNKSNKKHGIKKVQI